MADEMMRTGGRTSDGVAKPFSVEVDNDGNGVMRVVDAAPLAYDDGKDAKRVTIVDGSQTTTAKVKQHKLITSSDSVTIEPGERHRLIVDTSDLGSDVDQYVFAIPAIDLYDATGNKGLYTIRFDIKTQMNGADGAMMAKLFEYTQETEDFGMTGNIERFPFFIGDRLMRCQITNDGSQPFTIYNLDLFLFKE